MKSSFKSRLALGTAAIAGALLLSGTLTSCDEMLDPDTMYIPEERGVLDDVLEKIEEVLGNMTPGDADALPDIGTDAVIDPDYSYDPTETDPPRVETDIDTAPTDLFPVTEPPIDPDFTFDPNDEIRYPMPDVDVDLDRDVIHYYTSQEETGLSFTGGYVDRHMYLYGVLDEGLYYVKQERCVPSVQVIDNYDQFREVFDMSRKEFMLNAREAATEDERSFWNRLARMNRSYFDEWSLVVVLTPNAVEPFVNNEVRTYPIVGSNTSADITAIDLRTTAALYDKSEAAYAVIIPLYKSMNHVVAEDVVLGYDGALFIDERLHERVGDRLSELIFRFDEQIQVPPTWPVIRDPDVSVTDVLQKSRIEDGVLHAFLPEDPEIFGSDRLVFWVNSPDDIDRYLSFSANDSITGALGQLEENPANALIQSYLNKDADFFEEQWLVLILLRESSWSISYDASVEDRGNETHIQIDPVVGEELDNREAWWLLAVPVEAGDDYYVEINNLNGSRDLASYCHGNIATSTDMRIGD